jgi:diaminopimelate epimerase
MKFTKMHGLGNDYVYVDCFKQKIKNPDKLTQVLSDRHFGIGGDGLILIGRSKKADAQMRIFNADGSEAEMCGNGIRCVAKYVYDYELAKGRKKFAVPGQKPFGASLKIETGNGILTVGLAIDDDGWVERVCVNMGEPILSAKDIPVKLPAREIIDQPMMFQNRAFMMTCVSMGNPHAVFFRDDVATIDVQKFGPIIENHGIFPNRINVHFAQVKSKTEITMRTWERGSGATLACGTGACACCVAGVLTRRTDRVVTAHLPGGDLELNWCEADNCVYMTGRAVEVFQGTWPET